MIASKGGFRIYNLLAKFFETGRIVSGLQEDFPPRCMTEKNPKRGILHSGAAPLLWSILFTALFVATFYVQKPMGLTVNNDTIKKIFTVYGALAGPILAIIGLFLMYILAGIKRLVGLRAVRALDPTIVLLVSVPAFGFGYQLLYREPQYTDIARAIIGYLGRPLFYSSGALCIIALFWFISILVSRR